jgi:hypothetical protein
MSKKSFRARKNSGPDYPRLADLDSGGLRRWGLAAVGGLLIGGSACKQTPVAGEAELPRTVSATELSQNVHERSARGESPGARDARVPDGGRAAPVIPPLSGVLPVQRVDATVPPPGEPPLQRVEKEGSNQGGTSGKPKGQPVDKTKVKPPRARPHVDHATMAGKMRSPRVDPKEWEDQ